MKTKKIWNLAKLFCVFKQFVWLCSFFITRKLISLNYYLVVFNQLWRIISVKVKTTFSFIFNLKRLNVQHEFSSRFSKVCIIFISKIVAKRNFTNDFTLCSNAVSNLMKSYILTGGSGLLLEVICERSRWIIVKGQKIMFNFREFCKPTVMRE